MAGEDLATVLYPALYNKKAKQFKDKNIKK